MTTPDATEVDGNVQQLQLVINTGATTGTGTERISQGVQFRVRMVLADNFTNQYVFVAGADTWIPPNTQGYRVLITSAMATVLAFIDTPPGQTALARVNGQVCVLKLLENPVITSSVGQFISVISSTSVDGTLINQAATTTDVSAATSSSLAVAAAAGLRLMGWTVRETAGASGEIALRQGSSTGTKLMDRIYTATQSFTDWFGDTGLGASAGVYVDRSVLGTAEIEIYTKTQP